MRGSQISGRIAVTSAVIACGLTFGGCTSDGESSVTTTVTPPSKPLVGMRDGDTREVFIGLFCGADYLPIGINDSTWRAEELTADDQYWIPAEWNAAAESIDRSDALRVEVRLESNGSRLIATANGRSVAYRPMTPDDPENVCS